MASRLFKPAVVLNQYPECSEQAAKYGDTRSGVVVGQQGRRVVVGRSVIRGLGKILARPGIRLNSSREARSRQARLVDGFAGNYGLQDFSFSELFDRDSEDVAVYDNEVGLFARGQRADGVLLV